MIDADLWPALLTRLTAPVAFRHRRRAAKLRGFAATEAGSALDMLKAAELAPDAKLRRLFFRHALDEARHAERFRAAAAQLGPGGEVSAYELARATRQNLYQNLGELDFLVFVHLAERRGEAQFRALATHFADDLRLGPLFAGIASEERFHVRYSATLIERRARGGQARAVRWARWRVRGRRARDAWRSAGRVVGDLLVHALFAVIYLVVLPLFALLERTTPARSGWQLPARSTRGPV